MKILNRLLILTISLSSMAKAQLPFFLQRFRPVRQNLMSSGSTSYPSFASSLFPSSSFLSPSYGQQHNSFFSGASLSSPFSAASALNALSLSPYSSSASSLSPHFGASSLSSGLGSSSSLFAPSSFGSSSFASGHQLSSPHKFSASNLAHAFNDFGSSGSNFEGGFDQSELLDDYPGFSNAGFGKDLNFAGSQPVRLQSSPPPHFNRDHLLYLQRSTEQ